jgi:hypothetical protein
MQGAGGRRRQAARSTGADRSKDLSGYRQIASVRHARVVRTGPITRYAVVISNTTGFLISELSSRIPPLKAEEKSRKMAASSTPSMLVEAPGGKRKRQKLTIWEIAPSFSPSSKNMEGALIKKSRKVLGDLCCTKL